MYHSLVLLPNCRSSAEPTEEQPPEAATPIVIQPAQPQGDLLGGDLLNLLDIPTGPPPSTGPTFNAPAGGTGMSIYNS